MAADVGLVRRLIAFFKRAETSPADGREPDRASAAPVPLPPGESRTDSAVQRAALPTPPPFATDERTRARVEASRLDALLMRCLHQFDAHSGFVIRYDDAGRMRYLTGRDAYGRFVGPGEINPDRSALQRTLHQGAPVLLVSDDRRAALLCGPLRVGDDVVGALYLDRPSRYHRHRAVFDILCGQVARTVGEGA